MGKVWGLIFIVAAIYVGMEYYTVGGDKAFGGALAWLAKPLPAGQDVSVDDRPLTQRVRSKVTDDIQGGYERREDLIDD